MESIMKTIKKINTTAALIAGLAIFVISIISGIEAVSRNVFNMPLKWAGPFSQFLLLYGFLFGSAYCFQRGGHVSIDLLVDGLNNRWKRRLKTISHWTCAVFVGVLGWKGLQNTIMSFKSNLFTPTTVQVPEGYINIAIPLGAILMLLALLVLIWENRITK